MCVLFYRWTHNRSGSGSCCKEIGKSAQDTYVPDYICLLWICNKPLCFRSASGRLGTLNSNFLTNWCSAVKLRIDLRIFGSPVLLCNSLFIFSCLCRDKMELMSFSPEMPPCSCLFHFCISTICVCATFCMIIVSPVLCILYLTLHSFENIKLQGEYQELIVVFYLFWLWEE